MGRNPDILKERLVLFSRAKRELPLEPSYDLLWRWSHDGLLKKPVTEDRERVKLEIVHLGGCPATSHEAYDRFLRAINRMEE